MGRREKAAVEKAEAAAGRAMAVDHTIVERTDRLNCWEEGQTGFAAAADSLVNPNHP